MREFQHRHAVRTLLYSKVTMVILFLIVILMLRSIMELNDKRLSVQKIRNETDTKKNELQDKVNSLEVRNQKIKTEKGIDEYIRTTQPVVKEGEGVIVIYDSKGEVVIPARSDMNVWERLIIWFNRLGISQ